MLKFLAHKQTKKQNKKNMLPPPDFQCTHPLIFDNGDLVILIN